MVSHSRSREITWRRCQLVLGACLHYDDPSSTFRSLRKPWSLTAVIRNSRAQFYNISHTLAYCLFRGSSVVWDKSNKNMIWHSDSVCISLLRLRLTYGNVLYPVVKSIFTFDLAMIWTFKFWKETFLAEVCNCIAKFPLVIRCFLSVCLSVTRVYYIYLYSPTKW